MPNNSRIHDSITIAMMEASEQRKFSEIPPPTAQQKQEFLAQFDKATYPRRERRTRTTQELWGDIYNDGLMSKAQQMLLDMALTHLNELDKNLQQTEPSDELDQRLSKTRTDLMNVCAAFQARLTVKIAFEMLHLQSLHDFAEKSKVEWYLKAGLGLTVAVGALMKANLESFLPLEESIVLLLLQGLGLILFLKSGTDKILTDMALKVGYNYGDGLEKKRKLYLVFLDMSEMFEKIFNTMRQESSIYRMRAFIAETQQELLKLGAK